MKTDYEKGLQAGDNQQENRGCSAWCQKKLADLGLKSKKRGPEKDGGYNDQFEPCDFTCDKASDGNFPYFTIILTLIHAAVYIYFVATDPKHNIAGFNK